jgi:cytochrome c-type biogenesis protein CcmH
MKYFLIAILFITTNIGAADLYPFHSIKKQKQFNYLIHQLRCVVCQDESLSESNASLAVNLRKDIYDMVQENKSNLQIQTYLVNRYGNFVLLKPPLIAETYVLWFAPMLLFCVGVFVLIKIC